MLGSGSMPPADHDPKPTADETAVLLKWIDQAVFDLDCGRAHDPGHVTIRRLNRAEYNNTIRDLVGIGLKPADDFPSDDVGNGFDNMGDVLSLSPLLLEKYLTAAESISSVALFGFDLKRPPVRELDNGKLAVSGAGRLVRRPYTRHKEVVLSSADSVEGKFACAMTGDYVFCVAAAAQQAGDEIAKMSVRIDGQSRKLFVVKGDLATLRYELRLSLLKGEHTFSAKFTNPQTEPPAPPLPRKPDSSRITRGGRRKGEVEIQPGLAHWSSTSSSSRDRSGSIRVTGRWRRWKRESASCSRFRAKTDRSKSAQRAF